jgi:hypothetical protein
MKSFRSTLLILLIPLLCVMAIEPLATKVYRVNYADPQELAEIIPVLLTDTHGVVAQAVERQLIVKGTAAQQEAVRQILRDLDAPPKNIQIDVQFGGSGQSAAREAGIAPRGPIVIRNGEIHGAVEGRFSERSSSSRENTRQMLVAMDGHSASLRVGERVPQIEWLTEYGYRHGYVRETGIVWRDVGAFLSIEPTIVGPGLIRVRVIPEISGRLEDGRRERIQFTELATEITAADGQTIHIGGFSQDKDFSSRFFLGGSSGGQSASTDITLTPHILP